MLLTVILLLFRTLAHHFFSFLQVDVLDRGIDINDLVMDIDEANGNLYGPLLGCLKGCFSYWCLCEGACRLCFPHRSSKVTVKAPMDWCPCCSEETTEV